MQDDPVIRVVAKVLIRRSCCLRFMCNFTAITDRRRLSGRRHFRRALVLNAVVFGLHRARQVWPMRYNLMGVSAGVVLYGGTGVWSMLAGANYLDYFALKAT